MARYNLDNALDAVEMTYTQVVEISNDMLNGLFEPINKLINEIKDNINAMGVDTVRDYMLRLQLRSYEISETKEKSALKAECAESLRKEKYARCSNETSGTSSVKDNTATLAASEEIIVEALYNLVANLLKTKLDELHRLVAVLQSILMSKMQEAKFMNIGTTNDVSAPINTIGTPKN